MLHYTQIFCHICGFLQSLQAVPGYYLEVAHTQIFSHPESVKVTVNIST